MIEKHNQKNQRGIKMSKEATDRYSVKVEIPITVLLETIFSDDNYDVETLCRWVFYYGFIDLDKEEQVYRLQKDYNKQDFYVWLSKEERKQYDYESALLDRIDKAIEYIENNCYDGKILCHDLWEEIPELLDILKGGDKDESNRFIK